MPTNYTCCGSALVVVRTYRTLQDREERSESVAAPWTKHRRFRHDVTVFVLRCSRCCCDAATFMKISLRCDYASVALRVLGDAAT